MSVTRTIHQLPEFRADHPRFSFTVPLMLKGAGNGGPVWGVKTGFFFAGTGIVVCVIGWFIIPEVAQRTPAEINEL
jgi:hypothetical protein